MKNTGKRRLGILAVFILAVLFAAAAVLFCFHGREAEAAKAPKQLASVTAVYTGDTVLVGRSIDLKKLTVMGLYTDGTYEQVKDYALSTYVVTQAGRNPIVLTSGGVSTTFYVNGKKVQNLTASYTKGTVTVGEQFNRDDLLVYVFYSDGTNEKITDYILSGTLVSNVGRNEFTVFYEDKSVKFFITGTAERKPRSIFATYSGGPVIVGNAPKREDFYVTVFYNDNTTEQTKAFELTPTVIGKEGENTVVVSFGGVSQEVKIMGLAKTVASITAEYKGLPVVIGKTIAPEDIKVTATFNDGSKDTVTNFTLSSSVVYKIGDNLITVFCGSAVAYINVRGVEAEIIDYSNSVEKLIRKGNRYAMVQIALNGKVDAKQILVEEVEDELVQKAVRRIVRTDKYMAFEVTLDDPDMDKYLPMTMKVSVPVGYDRENFSVFYTPNKKTIMAEMNGEFLKDGMYEFKMFQPGTYIIADCTEQIYVETLELEKTEMTLRVGRSASLDPVIYPYTATDKRVSYSSSRPYIVSVSKEGTLEALQPGTAIITVEALDGSGKRCRMVVTVRE